MVSSTRGAQVAYCKPLAITRGCRGKRQLPNSASHEPRSRQVGSLLRRVGGFWRGEGHGAEEAGAFLDEDKLIGGKVLEGFEKAGGPADFEERDLFGLADAEVDA